MKINKIWEDLESDITFSTGLLLRRYSSSVLPDVFLGLRGPEKFRCIATSLGDAQKINVQNYSNLKDIQVELIPDEKKPGRNILIFKLLNNQHQDVFSVLCEDLIGNILSTTNETQLTKELFNRLEKWKSLFDKITLNGLTAEEQRGLYGEIFFIRKFLKLNSDFLSVINSWVGCEKKVRDFQSGPWGVEVKTTCGNNHQKIHISSERQLDTSNITNLFLFHFSVDEAKQSGETLEQLIDAVAKILTTDFASLSRFKNKLLEAGYFEYHTHLYKNTGYFIRQEKFYVIENNFPRIEEKDIRNGVGDVKYSIILSQCSEFIKSDQEVFKALVSDE